MLEQRLHLRRLHASCTVRVSRQAILGSCTEGNVLDACKPVNSQRQASTGWVQFRPNNPMTEATANYHHGARSDGHVTPVSPMVDTFNPKDCMYTGFAVILAWRCSYWHMLGSKRDKPPRG